MRICCAIRLAQSNASPGLKIRRNVGTQPASAIPKTFSRNKPNKIFKYIYLFILKIDCFFRTKKGMMK